MTEKDLRANWENRITVMLLVLLGSLYLTNFSFVLSNLVSFNYSLVSKVIKLAPVAATVYALPALYHRQYSKCFIALVGLLAVLYAWSGILVYNSHYKEYLKYFITVCFPCMAAANAVEDFRPFLRGMKYLGIVFALLSLLILLLKQAETDTDSDYFMAYSYSSAIFAIALLNDVDVKPWCRIAALVGEGIFLVSIVLLGARGPLLTIFLFLVSKNLSTPKRSWVFKLVLIAAFGLLLLNYSRIFSMLNEIAVSSGIKSRTLSSLSQEEIGMSGRERFYNFYMGEIWKNPIKFRGIAYDWNEMGYPHQIFMELTYQLGFIGIAASIVIAAEIVYMLLFKRYRDPMQQTCDIFFLSIGVYTLLLSNSLWKSLQFWLWLGYMFNRRGQPAE